MELRIPWEYLRFSLGLNKVTLNMVEEDSFMLSELEFFIEQDYGKSFEVMVEP